MNVDQGSRLQQHRSRWAAALRHLLLAILLSSLVVPAAHAQEYDSDERLTMPRNVVAGDTGLFGTPYGPAIARTSTFAPNPGVNGNLYTTALCPDAAGYVALSLILSPPVVLALGAACEANMALEGPGPQKVWHAQHIVRLPNKEGRAYFMVSQSNLKGGWITLLETDPDAIDADDLLKPGASGRYIWQDVYTAGNPAGAWNHPSKMEAIGGLLLVAAQDWDTLLQRYANGTEYLLTLDSIRGGSEDAVLFYDIRDPEHPRYLGKITATALGVPAVDIDGDYLSGYLVRAISGVSLFRSPDDEWFLNTSGASGQGRTVKAITGGRVPYGPVVAGPTGDWDFSPLQPQDIYRATAQYGMTFNSLQVSQATAPGVERGVFWIPSSTENVPNIFFNWHPQVVTASPDGGILSTGPTLQQVVTVPDNQNTWNTPSVYVTREGMPVVYGIRNAEGSSGTIVQLHSQDNLNQKNYWRQTSQWGLLHPDRVVTSCADSGPGTLRHWLGYGGHIQFDLPPECNNTITLTSGPLVVYLTHAEVDAQWVPGGLFTQTHPGVTISGGGASRVFDVVSNVALTLRNVTIRDGFARQGAGLRNMGGTVSLYDCRVLDNVATWPFAGGDAGDGGGILNGAVQRYDPEGMTEVRGPEGAGTLWLYGTTVAGNTAQRFGGGIANFGGTLTIQQSTLSGNRAERTGGALYNASGNNEDLSPRTGTVAMENSTVAGNSSATSGGAGTGGLRNEPGGVMNVVHSTIVGNSNDAFFWAAGIANGAGPGTLTINGSIVANNLSGGPGFIVDVGGSFSATSPNLFRTNSPAFSVLEAGGTPPTVGDPGLAPLGDYGGSTQTMLPLPGSPVIDKMAPLTFTDQRGYGRDFITSEIGSVEVIRLANALDSPALTNVSSSNSADTWFGQGITHDGYDAARSGAVGDNQSSQMFAQVTGPGRLTFWWKVSAEGGATPDRLQFFVDGNASPARSIDGDPRPPLDIPWQQESIDLPAGVHSLEWRYTKDASGTAGVDAGFVDEVVFTPLGTTVLDATDGNLFSLRNIIATAPAGGTITIDPALAGAVATLTAGQIVIDKNLTIDASALAGGLTISGNDTSRIFSIPAGRTVNLRRLTLTSGRPPAGGGSAGGCLYNLGTVYMTEVTLTGCTSSVSGGGLHNSGTAVLTRSAVLGNQSGGTGGGIANHGTLTVENSTIAGNQAAEPTPSAQVGGGIWSAGTIFLRHATIANNRATAATAYGGGLVVSVFTPALGATIENSIIAGNSGYLVPDVYLSGGTTRTIASGRNLVGIGDFNGANTVFPLGPLVGNPASPVDAVLATVGDYGGPTPGMLPLDGSPAIDAALGGSYVPTDDQRQLPRPQGTARDLGAVEVQSGDPTRDADDDRMPDATDNCTLVSNPAQCDSDGDGFGNHCDGDLNNNSFTNAQDYILFRAQLGQASLSPTYNQADLNCNGFVNAQDYILFRSRLGQPSGPSGLHP